MSTEPTLDAAQPEPAPPATIAVTSRPIANPSPGTAPQKRGIFSKMYAFLCKHMLFALTVLIPTACGVVYYGFIASDVYISEARFIVRSPQRQQQQSALSAIISGTGFSRSQDDTFAVHDFVLSRDALAEIDQTFAYRKSVSNEAIDFASRFGTLWEDNSFEALFKYYSKRISVGHDNATNITVLQTRGYSAQDVYNINVKLLSMGERLVNQINERGRVDLVKYAQAEVTDAERRAKEAAVSLASFRNQRAVFDPERQSALQLLQVNKLQEELIASKLQLVQVRSLSPENPQIAPLQKRVDGLQREMELEMARVAGTGNNSLTSKAADYERLNLERAFADRQLASAMTILETARNEARRKTLYLERIVQPSKPDYALEPYRIKNMLSIFILGLVAWGILSMLMAGVREHQD